MVVVVVLLLMSGRLSLLRMIPTPPTHPPLGHPLWVFVSQSAGDNIFQIWWPGNRKPDDWAPCNIEPGMVVVVVWSVKWPHREQQTDGEVVVQGGSRSSSGS